MKIIHIIQFMSPGGLEKVVLNLTQEQIKNGHQVSVLFYGEKSSWKENFIKVGVDVIQLKKNKTSGVDFTLVKKLKEIIPNYQVCHTHDLSPMFYIATALKSANFALKFYNKPKLIHTVHGLSQIKGNTKNYFFELISFFHFDKIIFVSESDQKYYEKLLPIYKNKFQCIFNGIAPPELKAFDIIALKNKFKIPLDKKVVISVARVTPIKNHRLLVEHWGNKHILIICGPMDLEEKEYFNLNLKNPNVFFIGAQNNINELLIASDLFISMSKLEGLPMSVLEALSYEIPCLLSDIPGHRKFINNEATHPRELAYFIDLEKIENSKNLLIEKVDQILEAQPLNSNNLKLAKEWVLSNFSITNTYEQYLLLYQLDR